jgi:hypothetical protein
VKINANVDVIERSGVAEGRSFTVNFNEKLARMLSKGIYQNIIRAPIRELACNAIDSHRAAGKRDVPIRVHLPNNLEPYFEVQDEGVGLSDDGIYSLFTCYGGSDKDHNNEDIGGFGLGSKAPFAYTSSFNVTSVFAGVKRHYVMHKDELGKPHVTPMGEEATTDANGVTVRVPVKPTDFNSFRENAQEAFRWFEVPPTVSGNSHYRMPKYEFVEGFEKPMWSLIKTDNRGYYNNHRAMVLMANVAYPLRADSLNGKYHRLVQYPLVIRFNNGELEPAVSREDLNYDEHTVKVLEMRLEQVIRDMGKAVEDRISSATTMWQARVALVEMMNEYTTSDMLRTIMSSGYKPKWQGKDVDTDAYMYWRSEFNKTNPAPTVYVVSETYRAKAVTEVRLSSKAIFVLKDVSDASGRCRDAFYKTGGSSNRVYLIEGVNANNEGGWQATTCDQVTKWLKFMGDPEVILASSLTKPEKKIMTFKGMTWTGNGQSYYKSKKSANWSPEATLNTSQGGYYVTIEGLTPVTQDGVNVDLTVLREQAITLGILSKTDQIWGINKTNTKLIKANTAWKEIHAHVKQATLKLINTHKVSDIMHDRAECQAANGRVYCDAASWHSQTGHMQNVLGVYVREWYRMSKSQSTQINTDALRRLAQAVGITIDSTVTTPGVDLGAMWEQIMTKYPLFKHATRIHPTDAEFKHFVSYIEMIDASVK